jgi:hypothetical protein
MHQIVRMAAFHTLHLGKDDEPHIWMLDFGKSCKSALPAVVLLAEYLMEQNCIRNFDSGGSSTAS